MITWVDLETTGLTDLADVLEVALVVTEDDLTVVDTFTAVRPLPVPLVMDDYVRESGMHEINGLLDECRAVGAPGGVPFVNDQGMDSMMLRFLERNGVAPGKVELAGASVHFDRRMMHRVYPRTEAHMHYRNIDVSTVKTLCNKWAPGFLRTWGDQPHRALPDLLNTISQASWLRTELFLPKASQS